jgi:hypothetical protein
MVNDMSISKRVVQRFKQSFSNPYARHIQEAKVLRQLIVQDVEDAEQTEKVREEVGQTAFEMIKDILDTLKRYPMPNHRDQNTALRRFTSTLRDISRTMSSEMTWIDPSEISRELTWLDNVLDASASPQLYKILRVMINSELTPLYKLRAEGHRGEPQNFNEIEALLDKLRLRNPETSEESDVNDDLDALEKEWLKDEPKIQKIHALINGIISTLNLGVPHQLSMF